MVDKKGLVIIAAVVIVIGFILDALGVPIGNIQKLVVGR